MPNLITIRQSEQKNYSKKFAGGGGEGKRAQIPRFLVKAPVKKKLSRLPLYAPLPKKA